MLVPPEYDVPYSEIQESVENFAFALSKHLQAEFIRTPIEHLWTSHKPSNISQSFFPYFEKVGSLFRDKEGAAHIFLVDIYRCPYP